MSPVYQQHMAWAREFMRSPRMRALQALGLRLKKRTASTDNATLSRWANEVATRLQLTPEAVQALWRPLLVERGLKAPGGRPPMRERCRIIADEMERLPA